MTEGGGGQRKTLEMFSGFRPQKSPHMCVCVFGTTFCVGQKSRYNIRWTDSWRPWRMVKQTQ